MSKLTTHILLAAAIAPATAAFADEAGDSCCEPASKTSLIAAEAEKPSTRPAATADEMIVMLQQATSREEALEVAKKFVDTYPTDERAAQLIYVLAQEASENEAKVGYYRMLIENHGDTQFAEMAQGSMNQLERVGKPFELSFTPLRGEETMSVQEDLKGKVVVIDFWATWCGPCIAEMPKMKKLYAEYKEKGVEFIGVSLDSPEDEGGKDKLMAYVEENDIQWPQYYQGQGWQSEFSRSWGVSGIPTLFIIDADGNLHSTEARGQLETLIPKLIEQRDSKQASAQ